MSEILVIQSVTNGDRGYPYDSVVQLGIASADTDTRSVKDVLRMTIRSDTDSWTQCQREYLGGRVRDDEISAGTELPEAVDTVRRIVRGKDITSFDVSATIGAYLSFEPWDITKDADILPSISSRLPGNMRGTRRFNENLYIDRAYSRFFPDSAACGGEKDALAYAEESAHILLYLRDRMLY